MKSKLEELVIAVDVSGSTSSMLGYFAAKINEVLQMAEVPERITIVYWDAVVQSVAYAYEGQVDFKFETTGGGGTRFQPVLDYIEQEDIKPTAMLVLTDLYIDRPTEPDYPVVWIAPITSEGNAIVPSFGECVFVDPFSN